MNVGTGPHQASNGARFLLLGLSLLGAAPAFAATTAPDRGQLERVARVRVPFVENRGQLDRRVAFSAPTFFGTVFVTRDGKLVYSLPKAESTGWTLTETLVSGRSRPTTGARAVTRVSYFQGNNPKRWQKDLPTYDEVGLGEVWRGITVSLRAHGGNVEKVFTIQPGARVEKIRMHLEGAMSLSIGQDGALIAGTWNGEIRFTAPVAYQEKGGARQSVSVRYVLDGIRYGFRLGSHDRELPVVIDPLLQSTYLGGGGNDVSWALAIHPTSGEIVLTGSTVYSNDFPGTAGGAQPTNGGGYADAFVARLDSTLTTLLQATYLGGSDNDYSFGGIAIHPTSGEVLVAGSTTSSDFPGTTGGAQPRFGGETQDGFIARFDSTLTTLLQASYLGGSSNGSISALAIHPTSGEILTAGSTFSTDFPGTAGGAQPAPSGGLDVFVARLNPTLTRLLQTTYLGGVDSEHVYGIAIHPASGEVFVTGDTFSHDFHGTAGGAQQAYGGSDYQSFGDGFAARLDPSLTTLLQATFLGGSRGDTIESIAIHPTSGDILVAGATRSDDFPGTAGGALSSHAGGVTDGIVARLNPTLTVLFQATYLGGNDIDFANGIAIQKASDEILVLGGTHSIDFPGTAGGVHSSLASYSGAPDSFVARLTPTLTALIQATYLGGNTADWPTAISAHPTTNEVLATGYTDSVDFPGTAAGAQPTNGGGFGDAFVARLTPDLSAILSPRAFEVDPSVSAVARSTASDGNGMLEPDETVAVRPTWKNSNGDTISPTGTAVFSGPPVATYSTPDNSATYGSIVTGQTSGCASAGDCYQLFLSEASERPTHFDATLTETLSTKDYKFWSLHVGDSFADVSRNHFFYHKVETLLHQSITAGCTNSTYCPDDPVSRAQMAIFMARAIAGSGSKVPTSGIVDQSRYNCVKAGIFAGISTFSDVSPNDIFCKHVHYLADQNVTLGCGAALYCPTTNVSRGEMAVFIARALFAPAGGAAIPMAYGPDAATGLSYSCDPGSANIHFTDVSTTDPFCKHLHYVWAKGVIDGCSDTEYCPEGDVTRGAMAKFLANAFQLALYGP